MTGHWLPLALGDGATVLIYSDHVIPSIFDILGCLVLPWKSIYFPPNQREATKRCKGKSRIRSLRTCVLCM